MCLPCSASYSLCLPERAVSHENHLNRLAVSAGSSSEEKEPGTRQAGHLSSSHALFGKKIEA